MTRIRQHHPPLLALLLLMGLFAVTTGGRAASSPQSSIHYYRSRYGTVAPGAEPGVERTFRVFEQLRAIAGGLPTVRLEVNASSGSPWSLALADGYVVLSLGAVQRCYLGVGQEEGDARIAFIVGHELAHLANNDFWHQESFLRLVGRQEDPALLTSLTGSSDLLATTPAAARGEEERCRAMDDNEGRRHCLEHLETGRQTALEARRGKELAADDQGFLYAAMAGFQVDRLVASPAGEDDFLGFWVRQTGAGEGGTHPASGERTALLRNRLQGLTEKVELFRFGVRQAAFGHHEAAIAFFDQFRTIFPSREVLNNLGYCYLARALEAMPQSRAYRYWLPLELGFATRLDTLAVRGGPGGALGDDLPPAARADLQQAVQLCQAARERDEGYLPAQINLAVALFLQGEIFEARAAVEHAVRLDANNLELQGFKALVQAREEPPVARNTPAILRLQGLASRPDCPPSVRFNLARLLEEAKDGPGAVAIWQELATHCLALPAPFRGQVVRQAGGREQGEIVPAAPTLPWELPSRVALGRDIVAPAEAAALFPRPEWRESGFTAQGLANPGADSAALSGRIFTDRAGDTVLAMDDFVEMVVLKGGKLGTSQGLLARCGPPRERRTLAEGELWSYGPAWMALVKDNSIKEVWVARLQ